MIKNLKFVLLFLLFINCGKSALLINTENWREFYLSVLFSHFKGFECREITNLGDVHILLNELGKNKPHLIFESSDYPSVKNLAKIFRENGFANTEKYELKSFEKLQFELYKKIKSSVDGFIVIDDKFSYYAILVAPFALQENYWVLFYNPETEEQIVEFLNREKKPVIWWGKFLTFPWKKLKVEYRVWRVGDVVEEFKKILEKINDKEWVIAVNGAYLECGFLRERKPITLTFINTNALISEMLGKNITILEVVGPENVNFAQSVREGSGKKIGVVVKTGRTFTGALKGRIYPLATVQADHPKIKLLVKEIFYDKDKEILILVFKNEGNARVAFKISSLKFGNISLSDDRIYSIAPFSKFFYPIYNASQDTLVEIIATYGWKDPFSRRIINEKTKGITFQTNSIKIDDDSKVGLERIVYNAKKEEICVYFVNEGKEAYLSFQLFGLEYLGEKITISPEKPIRLKGNSFRSYCFKFGDYAVGKELNVTIYYGESMDLFPYYKTYQLKVGRFKEVFPLYRLVLVVLFIILLIETFKKIKRKKKL